jgi:hypothetical protein
MRNRIGRPRFMQSFASGGSVGGFSMPDAPLTGGPYGRFEGNWVEVPEEAPKDGQIYGRQNAGGGGLDIATGDARYVNVTGDTMTGALTVNAGIIGNSLRSTNWVMSDVGLYYFDVAATKYLQAASDYIGIFGARLHVPSTVASTSPTTGALTVAGGLGVNGRINAGEWIVLNAGASAGLSGRGGASGWCLRLDGTSNDGTLRSIGSINIGTDGSADSGSLQFGTSPIGSGGVVLERMVIRNNGDIGIGVFNPVVSPAANRKYLTLEAAGLMSPVLALGINDAATASTRAFGQIMFYNQARAGADKRVGQIAVSTPSGALDTSTMDLQVYQAGVFRTLISLNGGGDTVSMGMSTASTSPSTGALVVAGGVGVGGALNVTGAFTVSGIINALAQCYVGGLFWAQATTNIFGLGGTGGNVATLRLDGGTGAAGGGNIQFAENGGATWTFGLHKSIYGGANTSQDITLYNSAVGNALIVSRANNSINMPSGAVSSSPSTGALVVAGGVGVGGTLNVSNNVKAGSGLFTPSNANVVNAASVLLLLMAVVSGRYGCRAAAHKWCLDWVTHLVRALGLS